MTKASGRKTPSMFAAIRAVIHRIPRGRVATYGSVARAAGHPGAARQVVWALHASPPGLPWHRVLGAHGRVLLQGEHGLEQQLRLQSEGVRFSGGTVLMEEHEHKFGPAKRRSRGK